MLAKHYRYVSAAKSTFAWLGAAPGSTNETFSRCRRFLLLATAKSIKRRITITELVVVWSLRSIYASMTKSKAVILNNTSRFLL